MESSIGRKWNFSTDGNIFYCTIPFPVADGIAEIFFAALRKYFDTRFLPRGLRLEFWGPMGPSDYSIFCLVMAINCLHSYNFWWNVSKSKGEYQFPKQPVQRFNEEGIQFPRDPI